MTTNQNKIRIVVQIEGGLVRAVYSNTSIPFDVAVQDFDIEGADYDEIFTLNDGSQFLCHLEPDIHDDDLVAHVYGALDCVSSTMHVDTEKKYVENFGKNCPNCGSDNIFADVSLDSDGPNALRAAGCLNCHSKWKDRYVISGFSDLQSTPLQVISSQSERGYWQLNQGWVFDVASATKFPSTSSSLNSWTFKPHSSGDDAELVPLASASDFLINEFHVGDEVFWNDPDNGLSSGLYEIHAIHTETGKLLYGSDVCFLKNVSGSQAEVFASELS